MLWCHTQVFLDFQKYHISPQNPTGLAFTFIEKCRFVVKTGLKEIFLHHEAHITTQLDGMVSYITFYEILKITNFASKCKGVSPQFYR
jgi:hypothetical protein